VEEIGSALGGLSRKALLWAGSDTVGGFLLTFAAMLLMARFMQPEQYGTGALVIGAVQALNLFVGGLFHDALIQNPDTDDRLFETALTLVLLISAVIVTLSLLGAGGLGLWGTPRFVGIGWFFFVSSLALPVCGAGGVINAKLRRDLDFRSVARANLAGRVVGCTSGLILAATGFGVWGLIAQFVVGLATATIVLFQQSGWRPRLRNDFRTLWPVCRFALPYALMHSLVALRIQAFLFLVTAFMGLAVTGYINVAFRLTFTPLLLLADAFTNLGLPWLARHQREPVQLRHAFAHFTQLVQAITLPVFIGLALTAGDVVPTIVGAQWNPVIPLVQVAAIGAAVSFLRFPASTALRALGYVRYSFASSSFQFVFTVVGMMILQPRHPLLAMWLWVLPTFAQAPLAVLALRRVSPIGARFVVNSLIPVAVATLSMSLVVLGVTQMLQTDLPAIRLVAIVASGSLTVLLILFVVLRPRRAYLRRPAA
jgi:PST family polysaccharide transporter